MSAITGAIDSNNWTGWETIVVLPSPPMDYLPILRQYDHLALSLTRKEHEYLIQILIATDALESTANIEGIHTAVAVNTIKLYMRDNGLKASDGLISKRFSLYESKKILSSHSISIDNTRKVKKFLIFNSPYSIRSMAATGAADQAISGSIERLDSTADTLHPTSLTPYSTFESNELDIFRVLGGSESYIPSILEFVEASKYKFFSRKWLVLASHLFPKSKGNKHNDYNTQIKSLTRAYPLRIAAPTVQELATMNDARTIFITITLCMYAVGEAKRLSNDNYQLKNEFVFSLDNYCALAQIEKQNTNRATFWKSLSRLNSTSFAIILDESPDAQKLRDFIGLRGTASNLQFINSLTAIDGDNIQSVRHVSFSLDPGTFASITEGMAHQMSEIMLSHSELLTYSQGILHSLYQWLNRKIHRYTFGTNVNVDIRLLKNEVAPANHYSMANFQADLMRLIDWLTDGRSRRADYKIISNTHDNDYVVSVRAFGFNMLWDIVDGLPVRLIASQNPNDALTGKKSQHLVYKSLDAPSS